MIIIEDKARLGWVPFSPRFSLFNMSAAILRAKAIALGWYGVIRRAEIDAEYFPHLYLLRFTRP